jgi:cytochrome c553
MRIPKILFCLALLLATTNTFAAGDYEAGKIKAYTCTGCHGIVGYKNTYPTYNVPRIGGQNAEYVVLSLKAFRSGERTHKNMNLQAEALSDQDSEDIAVYLDGQKAGPAAGSAGNAVAGQNKSAVCHACHGATGIAVQPIYPNLGGQHQDYLGNTLRAFRDGSRQNAIMGGFAVNLSDQDIDDITAWYASQSGLTEIQDK